MNYWERRRVFDVYEKIEDAEKVSREIAEVYRKASAYLKAQADLIFGKFKSRYGLSGAAARRLLNRTTDVDSLLRRLRNAEQTEDIQALRMELESVAYQSRLDRLRSLETQIDALVETVYAQDVQKQGLLYAETANEGYYKTMYRLQQQANAGFSFAHINPKEVDRVMNSRWSGQNYSERIWGNTQKLAERLKEELLVSLLTGRTSEETARVIDNEFHKGAFNSRRLVRTETNYVYNELSAGAYKEAGVEEYLYLATLDLRTSEICRSLDGKIFKEKDRKVGENCPPMHPWCRSTTIAVVDRKLLDKLKRRALDPVTGKRVLVPLSMTYEEWYEKFVVGNEKAINNRASKGGTDMHSRDLGTDQYVRYVSRGAFKGTPEEFRRIKEDQSAWEELKREYRKLK